MRDVQKDNFYCHLVNISTQNDLSLTLFHLIISIMNIVLSINIISLVVIYLKVIKTEDYEDNQDESNASASVDSESNEVFNASSKEKPQRLSHEDVKINLVNDKVSFNITTSNASESTTEAKSSKCNTALLSYPYSVSIQRKGSHYATGALIDRKWIITVASEFYNIRETIKLFRARLGSVNCKKGGTLVPLKEIKIHPSYKHKQPNFDISMLRIGQLFEFSDYIKPISLTDVTDQIVSGKFLTTYWPRLIVNGKVLQNTAKERMKPNSMRVSTQKMIVWDKCHELMQAQNYSLDKSTFCLTPIRSHHSSCMPDAGAPITAEDSLWGITSGWTMHKCQTQNSPTIVTRTSLPPIQFWLDSLLNDESI